MRIDFSRLEKEPTRRNDPISKNILKQQSKIDSDSHSRTNINPKSSSVIISDQNRNQNTPNSSKILEKSEEIRLAVHYPYDISRSLSPDHFAKEIEYMKSKQVLPESTLKFIKKQISREVDEINSKKSSSKIGQEYNQLDSKLSSKILKNQIKTLSSVNLKSFESAVNDLNYHGFRKGSLQQTKDKRNADINLHVMTQWNDKTNDFKKVNNHKVNSRFNQQKKTKRQILQLSSKEKKEQSELIGSTFAPTLNYNCKTKRKVQKERTYYFQKYRKSVFQSLYDDAQRYETKRSLERIVLAEQQQTQRISIFQKNKKNNNKRNLGSFYQRLEKSLEKQAKKKKLQQTFYETDHKTGLKMFQPNTLPSKLTFQTIYKESLHSFTDQLSVKKFYVLKSVQEQQKSDKDRSTTIKFPLHTSLQKIGSVDRLMNRSAQLTEQMIQKIVERYVLVFYGNEQIDDFNRNYHSLAVLNQMEYHILDPFLTNIQETQKTQKVSSHAFKAKLKHFYQKLTLYDKLLLRQSYQIDLRNKKLLKNTLQTQSTSRENVISTPIMAGQLSRSLEKVGNYYDQVYYYV